MLIKPAILLLIKPASNLFIILFGNLLIFQQSQAVPYLLIQRAKPSISFTKSSSLLSFLWVQPASHLTTHSTSHLLFYQVSQLSFNQAKPCSNLFIIPDRHIFNISEIQSSIIWCKKPKFIFLKSASQSSILWVQPASHLSIYLTSYIYFNPVSQLSINQTIQ